jgi:hypothetical protein
VYQQRTANRVGSRQTISLAEKPFHHCAHGSRIQRFIKMWGNFHVIRQQRFVPSFSQSLQGNGSSQNRALCNCPSTHPGTTPLVSLFRRYTQSDLILSLPFPALQPGSSLKCSTGAFLYGRPSRCKYWLVPTSSYQFIFRSISVNIF